MTILAVRHLTTYRYRRPVMFGEHRMMLRPRDSYDQKLLTSKLDIAPSPASLRWIHDAFGNCVAIAEFGDTVAAELRFESNICLDHSPANIPDVQIEDYARTYPFSYSPDELPDLLPVIKRQYPDPQQEIRRWVRQFIQRGRRTDTASMLMTLTYAIKEGFIYERRQEQGTWDPVITLRMGRGSCRDLALLMIEAVRTLGLAARFVSGYLYVPTRDSEHYRGGGSTHAWCQVYLPGAGWVEFDPTNGIVGNHDLVRIAVVRDPSQAIPLYGSFVGDAEDDLGMTVNVRVRAVPPPSTVPASDREAGTDAA